MATHNQAFLVGYLKKDPDFISAGSYDVERAFLDIRTCRRHVDNYNERFFEDILVYYDGNSLMNTIHHLEKYDIVLIKGVVNIIQTARNIPCPYCGHMHYLTPKQTTFIYPIYLTKIQSLSGPIAEGNFDEDSISSWLQEKYMEISNQVILMGKVVKEPEMCGTEKNPCCRYPLAVDRKYYIPSQCDISADYPWVYSYGQQAEWDCRYLKKGSEIMVDGVMRNERVRPDPHIDCGNCGSRFYIEESRSSFVPYSIEYLSGYLTDLDLERQKLEELLDK